MSSPGGFMVRAGLYRVPDLLTEEQLKDYFLNNFGVEIELHYLDSEGNRLDRDDPDFVAPDPSRDLGQSFNLSPVAHLDHRDLTDSDVRSLMSGEDPALRAINNRTLPPAMDTTPVGSVPAESVVVDKREDVSEEEALDSAVVVDDDDDDSAGDNYDRMSYADLQAECKARGLTATGTQSDLIARLRENDLD